MIAYIDLTFGFVLLLLVIQLESIITNISYEYFFIFLDNTNISTNLYDESLL